MVNARALALGSMLALGCVAGDADDDDLAELDQASCAGLDLEITYDQPHYLGGGRVEQQEAYDTSVKAIGSSPNRRVRSRLAYGDPPVFGPRAETAILGNAKSRYAPGDSRFYGFRVLVPKGWVNDGTNEDILFQWKNVSDHDLGEADKTPDIFIAVKRDELVLRITHDKTKITTPSTETKLQYVVVRQPDFTVDTWHDFVLQADWSYAPGSGRVKLWHKKKHQSSYAVVADYTGPNMHNDDIKGYLKWGIYKPSWRNGPTAVSSREVQHDNIRVGGSFAKVRPDRTSCP